MEKNSRFDSTDLGDDIQPDLAGLTAGRITAIFGFEVVGTVSNKVAMSSIK